LPPLVEPASELTPEEIRRYSRHLIIPDVAMAGQKRMKNAKVLCVGAGGLGSPALMYLAAAGVGTLGIIDFDTVDESNLQRQVLHSMASIGMPKTESARIARLNGELGGSASPGAPVLYATSDTPEVQVALDSSQQGQVVAGDLVRITLPGNIQVTGKVDRLGRVAQVPAGQNSSAGQATIPAFISLDDAGKARGLDRAPVRVEITTGGVENALSVPVTALVGKAGGGFAVEVVRAGGRRDLVAVKLGLFDTAGGRVQVDGGLQEGDQVVVPST